MTGTVTVRFKNTWNACRRTRFRHSLDSHAKSSIINLDAHISGSESKRECVSAENEKQKRDEEKESNSDRRYAVKTHSGTEGACSPVLGIGRTKSHG